MAPNSSSPFQLRCLLMLFRRYGVPSANNSSQGRTPGRELLSSKSRVDKVVNTPQVGPTPPKSRFSIWSKLILGSFLSLLLPLWNPKWNSLLRLEGNLEKVVEEVEDVAEVVEKVATVTEKVAADVANKLPDNSKLKEAATVVEHVSRVTMEDAQATKSLINKVDALEHDLKDLKTIVEPVIDQFMEVKTKHDD